MTPDEQRVFEYGRALARQLPSIYDPPVHITPVEIQQHLEAFLKGWDVGKREIPDRREKPDN